MDPARWERLQFLFHAAADLPATDQRAFLDARCGDDETLVAQTLALLAEDARGESLLDHGVAVAADHLLGGTHFSPATARFGPYRITRVLGEGGMGIVYLGTRDDLGTLAAVKILRDAWLSPARRERFASEQRTLAQLNHPLIARLYDADTLPDGTPWFVMEFVEGLPLTEYCVKHSRTISGRLRLFRDVCEAVQHAHRLLVVHRDLKPSNILVTDDGTVKLLDFGIAKQLESLDGPSDQKTRTMLRLMTPAYAAPEQIRGGRVGTHTDIYSLGVILYELLVGRLPFDLSNRAASEVETIVLEQSPERPSIAAGGASAQVAGATARSASRSQWADLDVLCLTAMHKDPLRRYATVDALIRDVDHYLKSEPLEARPDSVPYRLGKFVRRNWEVVSAASVVLVVVLSMAIFYTVRLTTARNTALSEAERTQRIQRFTLNLFEGGDKAAGPAESLRVATLVDRGLQEARSLASDPAIEAELDVTLGSIYQKLGKLARADSLIAAALEKRRALHGAVHPDVAATLVALASLRVDQARFEEAERLARAGLEMSKRTLPPNHPGIVKATIAVGRALQERGAYDKAIPVLQEAVRLNSLPGAAPADLATSLSSLADAHFYSGHYAISDSLNRRVLAMYTQLYGERHPLVADILINLGASQLDRGNYVEAERFDRQALDITRAFYGNDHQETAAQLTMLGRALVYEKRFDDAAAILRQALAIRERVYGPVHPLVASTTNELGNIAINLERYDEAEADFRRMLGIYRTVYGDKHYLIGIATSNLAGAYYGRHQYARAEELYRDAVRRFSDAQGANHMNTGIARMKLGRALLHQRRFAEAQVETLAGYEIMVKQANPAVTFVQNARKDLVAEYDSLKQPDKAARFVAELTETTKKSASVAKGK
jgi:serine/threonine-protein kinase